MSENIEFKEFPKIARLSRWTCMHEWSAPTAEGHSKAKSGLRWSPTYICVVHRPA